MTAPEVELLLSRGADYCELGRFDEAARCYRRLLELRPRDPVVRARLGMVLERLGRPGEALEHYAVAYLEAADAIDSRRRLVEALVRDPPRAARAPLRRALAALADDPAVRHERLAPAAARLLKRNTAVSRALRRIRDRGGLEARDLAVDLYRSLSHPLVLRLLRDYVFADAEVEALLTALRGVWLEAVVAGTPLPWPKNELLAAVALQALTTEWVYAETAEERDQLARLEATLGEREVRLSEGGPSRALLVFALYRSLEPFAKDTDLASVTLEGKSTTAELVRRHLTEAPRERALSASLPRLTAIVDDVSAQVRAQYEERPYPRWRSLRQRPARPLGEVLAATLDDPKLAEEIAKPAPRILVAGCGTGRHAIATATRFSGARVLAIDLSLASLGFAARQAEQLGVSNIRFAQADVLGLAERPERFDLVECTGVLHHMADPEAGWQVLRGLLEPRGWMRIALYSERGRSSIDACRGLIRERGLEASNDGIRAARAALRALPADAPARRIVASPDFFGLSGCRDMLFHAHEDRFDLPRIGRALERLGLEFLGFELPNARIRRLYRERFPGDPEARDLGHWDRLEAEIPSLFAAMYAFWCRARA